MSEPSGPTDPEATTARDPGRRTGSRRRPSAAALRERLARARAAAARAAEAEERSGPGDPIPSAVRHAAGWAVRLLLIGAGVYFALVLLNQLTVVVVPAVVSLLLAALLAPLSRLLRRIGVPGGLAPGLAFLIGVAAIGGLVTLIVREVVTNYQTIVDTVQQGVEQTTRWLERGPLKIKADTINTAFEEFLTSLRSKPDSVVTGTVNVVSTASGILGGILLVLLTTFFFLSDGDRIWRWLVRLFPRTARWKVNRAGLRAWDVLESYMGVNFVVAAVVGVATWLACLIAGVPLALSAGLVAFLFAFIPTLGAIISSVIVILLTLVSTGFATTVVIAIVVIAIQTLQGNVLYPILMNRSLKVHPLASLLLVVVGSILGGIFGALIAVPLAAVVNAGWIELLRASRGLPEDDRPIPVGPSDEDARTEPLLADPTADPAVRPEAREG